jgi:hypothetical protein
VALRSRGGLQSSKKGESMMRLRILLVLVCASAMALAITTASAAAARKHCDSDPNAKIANGPMWTCVDSYTVNGKTVHYGDPGFNATAALSPDPNSPIGDGGGSVFSWGWNMTVYYGRYYPETTDGANVESASFNLNGRQIQFRSSLTHQWGLGIYAQHVYWGCEYQTCGGSTLWGSSVSQNGYMAADVLYKPWFQWAFTTTGGYSYYDPKVTTPTNVRCNSAYTYPCSFGY